MNDDLAQRDPFDPARLRRLVEWRMPFGRYQGRPLIDLPEPYLLWFGREGFPVGELGELLQLVLEIKVNGLTGLLTPLRGDARRGRGIDDR